MSGQRKILACIAPSSQACLEWLELLGREHWDRHRGRPPTMHRYWWRWELEMACWWVVIWVVRMVHFAWMHISVCMMDGAVVGMNNVSD